MTKETNPDFFEIAGLRSINICYYASSNVSSTSFNVPKITKISKMK